jgi:septum formation protein
MLILASASPRRRDLLTQIGLPFSVQTAEIDETPHPGEQGEAYVQRLAQQKAATVFERLDRPPDTIVLGADTAVLCDRHILGKPLDPDDAVRMLRLLSGRTHRVVTAVAMLSTQRAEVALETTLVEMAPLSEHTIAAYVQTAEPLGKAGAYAIQGRAARFIPRVVGCYFNVVGLPLARVAAMLDDFR